MPGRADLRAPRYQNRGVTAAHALPAPTPADGVTHQMMPLMPWPPSSAATAATEPPSVSVRRPRVANVPSQGAVH